MDKTATILHKEFSDHLVKLINDCQLPAFAIKDTLRCALMQLETLAEQDYQRDLKMCKEIEEAEE